MIGRGPPFDKAMASSAEDLQDKGDALEDTSDLALELDAFPVLSRLMSGPEGDAVRRELIEFRMASRWQRAFRYRRNLLANLTCEGVDYSDVAIVRDISSTGARAWIAPETNLDMLSSMTFAIKVPGGRHYVSVRAEIVRVASRGPSGVEIAVRFLEQEESADDLAALLAALSKV